MESPYNEIHLSNEELSALKAAKDGYIKIDPSLKRLHAENLLYYNVHGFNGNPGYVITERGKAYLFVLEG